MNKEKKTQNAGLIMLLLTIALCPSPAVSCDVKAGFTITEKGKTAIFTNTSTGSRIKYHWDFGDGGTSQVSSPTRYYHATTPITYTVKLYAWDSTDLTCRDSLLKTVTVWDDSCYANAYFDISDGNTYFNKFILFSDIRSRLSNPYFKWLFGDGSSILEKAPEHTYASPGQYNLCLIVIDQNCSDTICKMVEIDSTAPFTIKALQVHPIPGFGENTYNPLSIYPNPGGGIYYILETGISISSMEISDSQGKLLPHELAESRRIDLSAYPPGLYLVTIHDIHGMLFSKRLIKY